MHRAAWAAALALWLSFPLSSPAGQSPDYPPATICATCHQATYESWARTFHALSVIDPVFVEALERTGKELGRQGRELCLMCHSPTTNLSGDFDLSDPISKEGVTCSFCHSVTAIDHEARRDRFTNEPARLKTDGAASISDRHSESHDIMMNAEFCAGCHEWVNALGLRVLSTYSEWKESFFAGKKIACQQCHMPQSPGGGQEGSKTMRPTNLHFQMGGHSQDQLVVAAQLDVTAEVGEKEIRLAVAVTNAKAGHKLPTGIPNRKMKLLVELYDRQGLLLDSRTVVYSRVIADAQGRVLDDVADQFVRGATELSDNRIAPKETRRQTFVFDRPAAEDFLLVEASLQYDILTPYLIPPVLNFDIVTKRVPLSLAGGTKKSSPALTLALIAAVFLLVTAAMILVLLGKGAGRGAVERKE